MTSYGFDSFSYDSSFGLATEKSEIEQPTYGYVSFGEEANFNQGE